jgi:alkylhydroperoxidase/carboxymuconolactone decarboxylase family protein YurZ
MNDEQQALAWVRLPSAAEVEASAPPGRRGGYDFGFFSNMGRLLRAHPRFGAPFLTLFAHLMFAPGALDRAEKEMVAAVAAAAQDCHY